MGKLESTYCETYLKCADGVNLLDNQRFRTNVCRETLDPNWEDQRFIFNLPTEAINQPKKYFIRILLKAVNSIGMDYALGQVDIQLVLKGLNEEHEVEGWFPIRPRQSILNVQPIGATLSYGVIRLRIFWVHTNEGLIRATKAAIRR